MKNTFTYQRTVMTVLLLLTVTWSFAQTSAQKQRITERYDHSKLEQLRIDYLKKSEDAIKKAYSMAAEKGWEIIKTNPDGTLDELMAVSPEGQPIYYTLYNVNAAKSTRADHLNIGGSTGLDLDGQNMTAHVWDGGPTRPTHQEFDGVGGNNRVTINDGVTALNGNSFHSQHVTGTIVASGFVAAAKGMAPQAEALTHEWANDLSEATTEAANGMLLSNHSYGFQASLIPDWYFGAYITDSRDWDNLQYNSPYYLMVVAAGNDGNDNSSNGSPLNENSSYDKLSGHATSKNTMVVANGQDANVNTDGSLNSVAINSSSSEGPTDDLRIKPDITGNGTSVYSSYDDADNAYNSITGTSMASPNVTGTLLLLQQHYNNVNGSFMRAATLKGLALHTADDAGISGPDAIYGWGLLNAKVAAEAISSNGGASQIQELTLSEGQTFTLNVEADGSSPFLASISWTDPAGTANTGTANLSTPVLINDLDIRVTQNTTTFSPYRLTAVNANDTGDNDVDPYERVDIASTTGTYTVTVTHKGSLSGGSQDYTLIVTGLGASLPCSATVPTGLSASNIGSSTADLNWDAVSGATYDVRYRQVGTSTWTTIAVSGNSAGLAGLSATTDYEAQVRSKCSGESNSAYSSSVNFTTPQVQLNYCASNGNNTSDEYIGRVQLGSIDNTTGASTGGYGDYTNLTTTLEVNASNTITVTPVWTGTIYNEGYSVWIDYNYDGDFTDAGEQVWSASASTTTPVSGSFTLPESATIGSTTMRVSMKYNGIPTVCESFTYGEVEDYSVTITSAVVDTEAPTAPAGLAAANTTETSTDLSWTASTDNVGVTGYDIYVDGVLDGSATGTAYTVSGLSVVTTYALTVSAKDAAGNTSAQGSGLNVATVDLSAPSTPSGLAPSSVTQTTLTLDWTAATDNVGVTGYNVFQGAANIGTVTGTSANITGLTENTAYTFSVTATDAAGNESTASDVVNVTTLSTPDTEAPTTPTDLSASSVTQTTLTLSWTASTDNVGVTGYDVFQGATNLGTLTGTSTDITGLTASTAYTFSVQARDEAGNVSASSNEVNVTTLDPVSGCAGGITAFPYSEGFESGIGAWTQDTSDNLNWTRDANGTPSNSTGPSSATEGSFYMYVESSGNRTGYPNKVAIFNSPCFDLSAESDATFTFSYHMYGSTMGTLDLQGSSDGTSWTSLWSMSGNQGNSWSEAIVDLNAYTGGTLQMRYVGTTSTSWRSDMAIDKLNLNTEAAVACSDVTLTLNVDNYPEETSWTITDDGGSTVASGGLYSGTPDGSTVIETACLPDGCYTFTISDTFGDGICCSYGSGSYALEDAGGTLLASGGSFTNTEATNFCLTGATSMSVASTRESVKRFVPTNLPKAYPNPVSEFLYLNPPADLVSISVVTVSGVQMKNIRVTKGGVDVSDLTPGVYMVLMQTGKTILNVRFVKY